MRMKFQNKQECKFFNWFSAFRRISSYVDIVEVDGSSPFNPTKKALENQGLFLIHNSGHKYRGRTRAQKWAQTLLRFLRLRRLTIPPSQRIIQAKELPTRKSIARSLRTKGGRPCPPRLSTMRNQAGLFIPPPHHTFFGTSAKPTSYCFKKAPCISSFAFSLAAMASSILRKLPRW